MMEFWIPVLVIFLSAVLGAIVKMRSRDVCLKVFDGCDVFLKMKDGRWLSGQISVYSNSLEIRYRKPPLVGQSFQKISHVLYEENLQQVEKILRLSPRRSTPDYRAWKKELDRLQNPSPFRLFRRRVRNVFNILRDAFSQAIPVVFGAVKKRSWLGRVPVGDDKVGEMGRTIFMVVPNAYEPILERYLGRQVVVERLEDKGDEQVGVLQEYTGKYVLGRNVRLLSELPSEPELNLQPDDTFDVVFPRHTYVVRHLAALQPATAAPRNPRPPTVGINVQPIEPVVSLTGQ